MYIIKNTLYNLLSILNNIKDFLQSLTAIDVIFFFAVLLLMILLVALLYFIKTNADYTETNDINLQKDLSNNNNLYSSNVLDSSNIGDDDKLINTNVNLVNDKYSSYNNTNYVNKYDNYNDEEGELLDLETITKKLENKELAPIDLSTFEEEQERDAIISYDELVNRSNQMTDASFTKESSTSKLDSSYDIPYKSEIMLDDLLVKEVDIKGLENGISNEEVKIIGYDEEEAFLDALKKLQQSLR